MRRREMALREREMTLREFQAGMTSTTSRRQSYDFQQAARSPSQFPEPDDEEPIPERTIDYDLDAEGEEDTPYYI